MQYWIIVDWGGGCGAKAKEEGKVTGKEIAKKKKKRICLF